MAAEKAEVSSAEAIVINTSSSLQLAPDPVEHSSHMP